MAISVIIIFFTLQYPKEGGIGAKTLMKWWGNTVGTRTTDYISASLWPIPEGGFGPEKW